MTQVYLLQHVHEIGDEELDVKFIGCYSSEEKARSAVTRLRNAPGFSDAPDGFTIDEYEVDKDHWVDGYVTTTRDC